MFVDFVGYIAFRCPFGYATDDLFAMVAHTLLGEKFEVTDHFSDRVSSRACRRPS